MACWDGCFAWLRPAQRSPEQHADSREGHARALAATTAKDAPPVRISGALKQALVQANPTSSITSPESSGSMRKIPSSHFLHSPDHSPRTSRNNSYADLTKIGGSTKGSTGDLLKMTSKLGSVSELAALSTGNNPQDGQVGKIVFPPPEPPPEKGPPAPLLNEFADLSQAQKDRELYDAAWDGDSSRAERLVAVGASPNRAFGVRK